MPTVHAFLSIMTKPLQKQNKHEAGNDDVH